MFSISTWLGRKAKSLTHKRTGKYRTSLALEALEDRSVPAVYLVTGTADGLGVVTPNGSGGIDFSATTLRAAVLAANASVGVADSIQLPAGVFALTRTGAYEDAAATGDLDVTDSLAIRGATAATSVVDGNNKSDRVFHVLGGGNTTLTLSHLTVRNGLAEFGGGIAAEDGCNVNIDHCAVTGNGADSFEITGAFGGGMALLGGVLSLSDSLVENNFVTTSSNDGLGGGIFSRGTLGDGLQDRVMLLRSTIRANSVHNEGVSYGDAYGGGLATASDRTIIVDCTIAGNTVYGGDAVEFYGDEAGVAHGGGIQSGLVSGDGADLIIENSTISGNTCEGGILYRSWGTRGAAGYGGGISILANTTARITNSTITLNKALHGEGQADSYGGGIAGSATIGSTIIAQNSIHSDYYTENTGHDLYGSFTSLFHNLIGNGAGATGFTNNTANPGSPTYEQVGTNAARLNPGLAALADNGGPTPTHALTSSSLARERGAADFPGLPGFVPATFDQRGTGFARTLGNRTDVGALEAAVPYSLQGDALVVTGTAQNDTLTFSTGAQHRITLNGVAYTFDPAVVHAIAFDGLGGNDTATLTGGSGAEQAYLRPGRGTLTGPGYRVDLTGTEAITANGAANDTVSLYDASGNDTLIAIPTACYLQGAGYLNWAYGFGRVDAFASTGNDTVSLYDSAGNDTFLGRPAYSALSGAGYVNKVTGFDRVDVFGSTGTDTATLCDSSGNDTFTGMAAFSFLSGTSFLNKVTGFDRVDAFASAGTDTANLYDSSGNDTFTGMAAFSFLSGTGFLNKATGFDRVDAFASAGQDTAFLYGSSGNDTFVGSSAYSYMTGAGYLNKVSGFERVNAHGTAGNDTADLYDSPGDDTFTGSGATGSLTRTGYVVGVMSFDLVRIHSDHGGTDRVSVEAIDYVLQRVGSWI